MGRQFRKLLEDLICRNRSLCHLTFAIGGKYGERPIRNVGVYSGLAPFRLFVAEAHPYGGGLLPPPFNNYANEADGLKPIRTVGVYSHRNRPKILMET